MDSGLVLKFPAAGYTSGMKKLGETSCRHFNGYRPCGIVSSQSVDCSRDCNAYAESVAFSGSRILIVHLGALGAVMRSTALLPAIKRKYPRSHITWVTDKPGDLILKFNPFVDRILTTTLQDLLKLKALSFNVAMLIDKSLEATGILNSCANEPSEMKVFGFKASEISGAVEPLTEAARALWEIGISDRIKFHVNRKTENQLVHEALELGPYLRDEYVLRLSEPELKLAQSRRQLWSHGGRMPVVGLNTGCAATIAAKKLSIDGHVSLIKEIAKEASAETNPRKSSCAPAFVLLGGREDTERNQAIAHKARGLGIQVFQSPTDQGIRDGIASIEATDLVISGDSFGLHLAIALKKKTVAWFGPTCAHEIDLYGRGDAVLTLAGCSPCWKRSCTMTPMCYDLVDFRHMARLARSQISTSTDLATPLEVSPGL